MEDGRGISRMEAAYQGEMPAGNVPYKNDFILEKIEKFPGKLDLAGIDTVPESTVHDLGRSSFEAATKTEEPSTELEPAPEVSQNALLGFGLSEQFNDCSIAAANACFAATERMGHGTTTREIQLAGREDALVMIDSAQLTQGFSLPSGRSLEMILGRSAQNPDSPLYLYAVTRGNIALPLASFVRRKSNIQCDYVQIGQEMNDENFVVVPTDEGESRLDIVEAIKDVIQPQPVDPFSIKGPYGDTAGVYLNLGKEKKDAFAFGRYSAVMELSRLGIVGPKLASWWQETGIESTLVNKARSRRYSREISELVQAEFLNDTGSPIETKPAEYSMGFYKPTAEVVHKIIQAYKKSQVKAARNAARLLDARGQFKQILGPTTPDYEALMQPDGLEKLKGQVLSGIRSGVKVGKTSSTSEFEIQVEPMGSAGYRLITAARPVSMSEHGLQHISTLDFYRDRHPSKATLDAAGDVLDLISHTDHVRPR